MDTNTLLQLLQATLDADPNVRVRAELSLAEATRSSETALGLARIATEQQVEVHLRQSASFALKKYVKEHWSPFFPTFKGPTATSPDIKAQVRQVVFAGLSDPIRKIRLACANIISSVAQPDWPDDWPTLMDELLALVRSPSIDAVEGGMRVLSDFVSISLTEDQLLPIARDMLPTLLTILGSPQTYGPATRARSILIFRQCVMTLFTVKDEHPEAVRAAIGEILPQWLDAFRQLLEVDIAGELKEGNWEGIAVRIAIFNALEVILNSFPSTLKSTLPLFVSQSSAHLSAVLPIYDAAYLSNSSDFSIPSTSAGDEDSDISMDLGSFVATILDFIAQAARRKTVRSLFAENNKPTAGLVEFLKQAIEFSKMTTEDEDTWASDPNAFVADEDDEMVSQNVRAAALDMSIAFVETFSSSGLIALQTAFESIAAQSEQLRSQSNEDWWKGLESALAVVGGISEDLIDHVQERAEEGRPPKFNLERVFEGIVMNCLSASNVQFLQGRAFVFASQYSEALPSQLAKQYIDAAIQVLDSADAGVPVKVSAVRALTNFFRHLKANVDSSQAALALSKLLPLLPQATENTLVLVLDAIQSSLKGGSSAVTAETYALLIKALLETWFAKPEDPILGSAISDVFGSLSSSTSPNARTAILNSALPALSAIMTELKVDPLSVRASTAVDIADNIFTHMPSPLLAGSFERIAENLFVALNATDDRDVTQSGLNIVTSVIRKDVNQLLTWSSASGQSGLELVLAQVANQLQPSDSEAGGLFVGDLVIHLLRKAGPAIGPVLPDLLKAFVNRLATAQTAMFTQSMVLPFAYVIDQQLDTALSLLESIVVPPQTPGAAQQPALEVLLSAWCDYASDFQGFWNQKLSTVALTKLYAASSRPSLQNLQVKGDLLITSENKNKIMTRARARQNPDQFPPIPFPAKALKLLLREAQTAAAQDGSKPVPDDAESDDGDDEWADEGAEFNAGNDQDLDFLSEMLSGGGGLSKYMMHSGGDSDDGEDALDEQDLKDDPIYNLDLRSHLTAFFHHAYETDSNSFKQLAEQFLNQEERAVLTHLLSSPVA
ncbi:karyopherin KAP114 [Sporobolomyces koalae]|uniref:karyopherin KAP114 n=1 Tax=Sporobolomyces koalae TaxID=500713 RepID=UPI0031822576